jgi:hypothetical protein
MPEGRCLRRAADGGVHRLRGHKLREFKRSFVCKSLIEDTLVTGSGIAALAGAGLSIAYLLTGIYKAESTTGAEESSDEEEESFVWSVATVVSLIPYVNWMVRCKTQPTSLIRSQAGAGLHSAF